MRRKINTWSLVMLVGTALLGWDGRTAVATAQTPIDGSTGAAATTSSSPEEPEDTEWGWGTEESEMEETELDEYEYEATDIDDGPPSPQEVGTYTCPYLRCIDCETVEFYVETPYNEDCPDDYPCVSPCPNDVTEDAAPSSNSTPAPQTGNLMPTEPEDTASTLVTGNPTLVAATFDYGDCTQEERKNCCKDADPGLFGSGDGAAYKQPNGCDIPTSLADGLQAGNRNEYDALVAYVGGGPAIALATVLSDVFRPACIEHDKCYSTCAEGRSIADCEEAFKDNLNAICSGRTDSGVGSLNACVKNANTGKRRLMGRFSCGRCKIKNIRATTKQLAEGLQTSVLDEINNAATRAYQAALCVAGTVAGTTTKPVCQAFAEVVHQGPKASPDIYKQEQENACKYKQCVENCVYVVTGDDGTLYRTCTPTTGTVVGTDVSGAGSKVGTSTEGETGTVITWDPDVMDTTKTQGTLGGTVVVVDGPSSSGSNNGAMGTQPDGGSGTLIYDQQTADGSGAGQLGIEEAAEGTTVVKADDPWYTTRGCNVGELISKCAEVDYDKLDNVLDMCAVDYDSLNADIANQMGSLADNARTIIACCLLFHTDIEACVMVRLAYIHAQVEGTGTELDTEDNMFTDMITDGNWTGTITGQLFSEIMKVYVSVYKKIGSPMYRGSMTATTQCRTRCTRTQ